MACDENKRHVYTRGGDSSFVKAFNKSALTCHRPSFTTVVRQNKCYRVWKSIILKMVQRNEYEPMFDINVCFAAFPNFARHTLWFECAP